MFKVHGTRETRTTTGLFKVFKVFAAYTPAYTRTPRARTRKYFIISRVYTQGTP